MYGLWDDIVKEYFMYFDESGNLGTSGKYFVIACIITENRKALHNTMKKTLKKIKSDYHNAKFDGHELKANKATKEIKSFVLNRISKNNLEISYIVAEKQHVQEQLIKDQNRFYNFLLKILLDQHKEKFKENKINLILDNKTIKVKSLNSFEDYINIHINYELGLNSDIIVEYKDSKSHDAYNIQAVDYIANVIYSHYEYNLDIYMPIIKNKIKVIEEFPKFKFKKIKKGA